MHSRTHFHINKLLQTFVRTQKPTLIDYGCGSGDLLEVLTVKSLRSYQGLDVNSHSLKELKKRFLSKKISTTHIDKRQRLNIGKSQSADVVVSVGVLQYMNDRELKILFNEVHRVLKPGGSFIFSCAHDQRFYKMINLYSLFLPNRYYSRVSIRKRVEKSGLILEYMQARGPVLNPLFSYLIVFFFDAIDKLIFSTKGTLGPIGSLIRKIAKPILDAELDLNRNIGYSLFVVATK